MTNEETARRLAHVYGSIVKKIKYNNDGEYLSPLHEGLADDALEIWRIANELHPQPFEDPRQLKLF